MLNKRKRLLRICNLIRATLVISVSLLLMLATPVCVFAATGDYNDPATASGTSWSNPTNVFLDDANRSTYTITSQDDLFATNFTVGADAGSAIDSIIIRINGYGTANGKNDRKIDVALTKNGTSEVGDVVTIELPKNTEGDVIFRGSTDDLWGTTWTSTEINATTFGVAINRTNTTSDSLVIDHVQITVWWSTQISGTVYSDEGVTNAGAGLTVRLIVNGSSVGTSVTDGSGAYSIGATVNSGDAMLVYIDQEAIDATTVTVSDGANLSGLDLYADHVITRHDNGGTLSNADMDNALGIYSDNEIEYLVTAGVLTVTSGNELYVLSGHTFAPAANVTADDVKIVGTFTAASYTFTVTGNWDASGGTFTPGTSTVKFTSTAATFTAGTSSYNEIIVDLTNGGAILTLGSNLDVNNDLTITVGQLDVSTSNYNITIGGDYSNSDVFTARSGTVTFDGTNQSITGSNTFYNFTKSVASTDTLTFPAGITQTFGGTVTINGAASNLLSLVSSSPGTRWNFTMNAGATKSLSYVDVKDSDASGSDASLKPIKPTNSTDAGNNDSWFEDVISGTVYTDEGVTNAGSGLTVRLIVNGVDAGNDVTVAGGTYSILAVVNSGDEMLVYIDQETINATTVTVSDGGDLSGLDLYAAHVITRHDNGGTLSNADMDAALGSYDDNEIEYSVTAGVLTVNLLNELYVFTGHTFAPAANVLADDVKIVGTFTAASGTFTVTGNWDASGGTYTPGTSTVKFTSTAATFTAGTSSYHDIIVELTNGGTILTLGSNLDVNNDLTITLGELDVSTSNYNITVGGDFTNSSTFTARSGTVTFDGTNQSITGANTFYSFTKSVASTDTLTFPAGATQTFGGTVTINGAASNLLSLVSSTPGTQWNFTVNSGATKSISYVDVKDSDASASDASQTPIKPTNSTNAGNNVSWFGTDVTISGTVYTDEGVTNAGLNMTVRIIVNGMDMGSDETDASGVYSITAVIDTGYALLVYVDGEAGLFGTSITISDTINISDLDIYDDHIIVRHDFAGSLTIAGMDSALGSFNDADIKFSITAGVLSVTAPDELYVFAGHTFAPGANISVDDIEILGSFTAGSNTFTVTGIWDASAGTFTPGTSTVKFTSTTSTFAPGTSSYYDIILDKNNISQVLTLSSNLDVNNDLIITLGDLDVSASNYNITVGGDFFNSSAFTARSGTFTFDGTNQNITGSNTFYNLTKSVVSADNLTFQAGATQTIGGTVTINGASGNLLSLVSSTPGTRWNFTVNAGATKSISYVDVKDSDASGSDVSQKAINPSNSIDGGNNIHWFGASITISGIVYTDEGITDANQNNEVRLVVNGIAYGSVQTDMTGAYSISEIVASGAALLVYVDDESPLFGTTVTVTDSVNLTGLDIYDDHVIVRHDFGGNLTVAGMDSALGSYSDADIHYSVTAGDLTVTTGDELYIPSGETFVPGGDVTIPDIKILGSVTGGSDTLTVSGNWDASGGTYTPGTSTVKFTSSSATFTAGTSSYNNVSVNLANETQILTLGSNLDVNNDLTITLGNLDVSATNYDITIGGDYMKTGVFTARNGTVTFDGTKQSISGTTTFYNLTKSVASVDTLTFQIGTTQSFNGTVTLNGASGNLLSLVSSSLGSQWSFTVNAGATKTISYVDVEDSDASNSDITQRTINPSNSVDGGNNLEWFSTALGVSISNATFAFGTVPVSTWLTAQSSIVKNSGQSVADMIGKISQFTTGGDNWAISATTNGADSVRSQWSTTSSTGPWTDISAYDSDFTIVSTLAVDGTVTLWFRIETPTTTTSLSQYSSTLTVTAQ